MSKSSSEEEDHKKKRKKRSSDSDRESKKKKKKHKTKGDKKKHKKKKSKKVSDSESSESEVTNKREEQKSLLLSAEKEGPVKEVETTLLAMLVRYPASAQELQFLFFKLEKDLVVDIRDLSDPFIKKSLKTAFQALNVERVKGGYQRSERTPPLLPIVECVMKSSASPPAAASASDSPKDGSSTATAASPFSAPPPRTVGPSLPSAEQRRQASLLQQQLQEQDSAPDFGPKMVEQMTEEERQANETLRMSREVGSFYKQQAQQTAAALPKHEEWMTALPAEFKRDPLDSVSNRKFSMEAKVCRGDTSQWTDTPLEKEARGMERLRTEAEKDSVLAELMSPIGEVKKRSVNATPEEAAAAAQAMLDAKSGLGKLVEREETLAEREKREFKEFCAKKKADERKRKELRILQAEAASKPWDRDEAFKSVRRLKGVAEQEKEISESSKLMGAFVDAGAQSSFL